MKTKEVVINTCFGGFGLSDEAYEKLIEYGIPIRKYTEEVRGEDGRYIRPPENEGEIIFDRELTLEGGNDLNDLYWKFKGKSRMSQRYWETWISRKRDHSLLLRVVKELKEKANGPCAELKIVEIPSDVEYVIDEYDGSEHIAEIHRTWR